MHLSLQDGWTALIKALTAGMVECVKVLLNRGAEVNMQDKVSCVIIHCTCNAACTQSSWRMYMHVLKDFIQSLKTSSNLEIGTTKC